MYSSISELPENVRKLPEALQKQWMEIFNSVYQSEKEKGASDKEAEAEAFTQANHVFKSREMAQEKKTKSVNGVDHPAEDFLVVEDPEDTSTWHLPVKTNGKPDHRLMGAAKAALLSPGGHRGNRYQGPQREEAIRKLKALYEKEGMDWVEQSLSQGVFLAQMSRDVLDRPIDLVAPGVFRDMWGSTVKIDPDDLEEYVLNTREALLSTRTSSGDIVGFPIDCSNHDRGDAAGWLIDVQRVDTPLESVPAKIIGTVRWTELGKDVIRRDLRRMFSPTLDLENKVILGGSLTNWPATRDKRGRILLKPVELSSGFLVCLDDSNTQGGSTMGEVLSNTDELTQKVSQIVEATLKNWGVSSPASTPTSQEGDPLKSLPLAELSEEAKKQRKAELQAQLELIKKQAELEFRAELARIAFETKMTELSMVLTGGTPEAPRGFPVAQEELKSHLMKLSQEEASFWAGLLEKTQREGLIEFQSLGSNGQPQGTRPLPKEVAQMLDAGELTIKDLSDPILGLGDLSQYDLTRWSTTK